MLDPHRLHLFYKLMAEDAVAIAQQILRRAVPRKGFPKLVSGPLRSGMCCHCEVNDAPTLKGQHQEHVQDLEANRGHGEEIDGDEAFEMILQERSPGL